MRIRNLFKDEYNKMKDNLKMEHEAERERQLKLMKERLAKRRLDQIEQFDAKNDLILAGYNIESSNKASFPADR